MCMVSSTCPRAMCRRIHWRMKVRLDRSLLCRGSAWWRWLVGNAVAREKGRWLMRRWSGGVCWSMANVCVMRYSQTTHRPPQSSQRRTIVHHHSRTHTSEYGREHQCAGQVVEHLPAGGVDWGGYLSGLVVEKVL